MTKMPMPSQPLHGEGPSRHKGDVQGKHDTGRGGRSERPSGSRDVSASNGVDPQDLPIKHTSGWAPVGLRRRPVSGRADEYSYPRRSVRPWLTAGADRVPVGASVHCERAEIL